MVRSLALIAALALALPDPAIAADRPIVIAHRGASGERPEHTLVAYERAIDQGADFIEPDLVVTKDLVLVARHENELSSTTDVASRREFEDRRRTKTIEGQTLSGWFAEDFTLAELRTLRVKERAAGIRPANARFDGFYQIPTFEEVVKLARAKGAETGRVIGLYPELKHPTVLLEQEGIDSVDLLVRDLRRFGLDKADAPVFVQVFEVRPLQRLNKLVDTRLILLIGPQGGPYDEQGLRWADMMTPTGLAEVATYADGIGPFLGHVVTPEGTTTTLVADAHKAGLKVHPWTLRKENGFLPEALRSPGGPAAEGDWRSLFRAAIASGADGFFTDNVKELVGLLDGR
ncbi:glycerophosphodiester phosphodiesterase family protein [Porphyrobacter sp. CACIAM 03H1]|uniref:glycerophosphodiester phosphodiesterase family protein n=1 Tax=Porphyrobacter sp. CACIAM 03H1 TaxID=2003315 RepID=UPI000B5A7BD3|nr:glycerophosphodiester phosphodiesterase family protein [Porphyrobacter sp. CACIAM 03H1]ASJ89507.1 glycerophosphodiester phosphodiesterase [Porphyrobacter sp. CACIAM 03H1]